MGVYEYIKKVERLVTLSEVLELVEKHSYTTPFYKEDGSVGNYIVNKDALVTDLLFLKRGVQNELADIR